MMRIGPLASRTVSPLQFLVLLQLHTEPKYGYEMMKALRDEFNGIWNLKTGSFYPALKSLGSRGFIDTELQGETEFYSLTPKGNTLIDNFGERIELSMKFTNRYLRAMLKLMPPSFALKAMESFHKLSQEEMDIYSAQMHIFDSIDKESKQKFLDNLRRILESRLEMVEMLEHKIKEF